MTEIERILDQLDRTRRGGAWHGPALAEILDGIDARMAAARPLEGGHTIWELTRHLATWQDAVRRRIGGEEAVPGDDENWPDIDDTSEAAWRAAVEGLWASRAALAGAVRGLAPEALDERPRPGEETRYTLLHGVVHHDLYHAGQMSLLAKAAAGSAK